MPLPPMQIALHSSLHCAAPSKQNFAREVHRRLPVRGESQSCYSKTCRKDAPESQAWIIIFEICLAPVTVTAVAVEDLAHSFRQRRRRKGLLNEFNIGIQQVMMHDHFIRISRHKKNLYYRE